MEHDVYVCSWKRERGGFSMWVKSQPDLRGHGTDLPEAEQELLDAIAASGGALHAVFEMDRPLPCSLLERKYSLPQLVTVMGDERFETDEPRSAAFELPEERAERERWYDDFFASPCCHECRAPGGPRSDRQLRLTYVRRKYDGGFVSLAGATLSVFSNAFLGLLSEEERGSLDLRAVDVASNTPGSYFELLGPVGLPLIAVAGLDVAGWVCDRCGAKEFGYWVPGLNIHQFIAGSDLPDPLPPVFTVGAQPSVSLCLTAKRWAEMVGKPSARGLVSMPLGVVPDREVVRSPELKTLQEQQ